MNIDKYLDRINFNGNQTPTLKLLIQLQEHHLLYIPFENLDIHNGIEIGLDIDRIFKKIVTNNRGGFCYELNGLFYELLKYLGFKVKRISARVYNSKSNKYGEEYDHFAIIAEVDKKKYLVDVGFGEFVLNPLQLILNKTQIDSRGKYLIDKYDEEYYRVVKVVDDNKYPIYIFTETAREFNEYNAMCNYHQTSPESHFTQKRLISKPIISGRVTISGDTLKITEDDKIIVNKTIDSELQYQELLLNKFNIKI